MFFYYICFAFAYLFYYYTFSSFALSFWTWAQSLKHPRSSLLCRGPLACFTFILMYSNYFLHGYQFTDSNMNSLLCLQYGNYQRRIHVEELNKKWNQVILKTSVFFLTLSFLFDNVQFRIYYAVFIFTEKYLLEFVIQPITPLEHCEWLNKLLMEVWPRYVSPKLSLRFSQIVEVRL